MLSLITQPIRYFSFTWKYCVRYSSTCSNFQIQPSSLAMDCTSSSLLKDEDIEKLKCTICNNYLSHFPIHTSPSVQNVCGRCPVFSENYIRNEIYEVVSQNIRFPCRYRSEACCETLLPKYIPQHEEQCHYKTSECLTRAFTKCFVKVSHLNMIKHCQEEHSEYFLKDAVFEIDTTKSQQYDYVLEHEKELVIFRSEFQHTEKIFMFRLRSVPYNLTFTCGCRILSVQCNDGGEQNIDKISLDWLISPEEPKICVKIHLKGTSWTARGDAHKELANVWKCSSCANFYGDFQFNLSPTKEMCLECLRHKIHTYIPE